MDLRGYLGKYGIIVRELSILKERISRLREDKYGVEAFFIKEVRSKKLEERISSVVAQIDVLEQYYLTEVVKGLFMKYEYHMLFESLKDPDERTVMELRYIDLMGWDDISLKMNFSLRNCYYLHKKALTSLERLAS